MTWWRSAVIYQIYPRSFADGNGDGYGDLTGLRSRLPYLAGLGVDGLWITPWYPSPLADGGYDVSDYCAIDPVFGSLDDADALVREAHAVGLRVLVDLVPNHTSEQHPWFAQALQAGPGSPERERYFFRDGHGPDGGDPPNNWISAFGGSAWTRITEPDGRPGQWYLHTFAPQQPDLDWSHPRVLEDFDDIFRFWLDRGVDGFRLDAIPALAKTAGLPDADYGAGSGAGAGADAAQRFLPADWVGNPHWDVAGVHDIFRRWRRLADSYLPDRILVGEAMVRSEERLADYLRPGELHAAFNFHFLKSAWDAGELRRVIDATMASHARVGAAATWSLNSHDEIRLVTRYGRPTTSAHCLVEGVGEPSDRALGTRRARAATLLLLALPGSAYLYQGEELGLPEVTDLPDDVITDPLFRRSGGVIRGRDGCRVPLPWSGQAPPFGFSDGSVPPWLPQPPDWAACSVEAEAADPGSMLSLHRSALRLRRSLVVGAGERLVWQPSPPGTLVFDRGAGWRCVVNVGGSPLAVEGEVLLASDAASSRTVGPGSAAWVRPA